MPSELRLVKKLELAELTDEDVMERCALGSETAFRALVQRYRSRIMNLVCRFINDRDRAEEISQEVLDRKSTRLNSSHLVISYAVFCLKKKKKYIRECS